MENFPSIDNVRCLMKTQIKYIFLSIFIFSSAICQDSKIRWHEFVKSDDLYILNNGDTIYVYFDLEIPTDLFFIFNEKRWVIRIDEKEVIIPVGKFYQKGTKYLYDTSSTPSFDRATGFDWNDPKIEFSFFNHFFRSPRFKDNTIKFWSGTKWCKIYGVANHKKSFSLKID